MALINNYAVSAVYAVAAFLVYSVVLAIYRLYFHPLAKFPGPKLAAVTLWFVPPLTLFPPYNVNKLRYEFYFDVVKQGSHIWKLRELHEEYGTYSRHMRRVQTVLKILRFGAD